MISRRRRTKEEVAAFSELTEKFCKVITDFTHEDLRKITEYYKPYLAYVIEYDITSILQNLATKEILTNDEAKGVKAKEQSEGTVGVESFINDVMINKDQQVLVSLWMACAEELVRFPSPNLTRILKEVAEEGLCLLEQCHFNFQPLSLDSYVKGLQNKHRENLVTSTNQPSPGDPHSKNVVLNSWYTELIVINQYRKNYIETQHELLKTGKAHAALMEQRTKEKCERIWTEQLFRKTPGNETFPQIVVVSGVAGIGKTTMVQKIIYDWAIDAQYKNFAFVFLFKFRELNILEENEREMPLTRLIVRHYTYLNDETLRNILQSPGSLLFIFDGLDEYKHKLDFTQNRLCSNPEDYFPIHILVTSLISRKLLKGCTVLITSRPTALESLNMDRVDRYAEILGFFTMERMMYFKKFFGDVDLGMEAFQYVEENAILYTMCFNPSYCWIICSVLKSHFSTPKEQRKAAPRTVTELFVLFLYNILTNHKREAEDKRGILVKLGKMAYYGVANKILVFYDKQEMFTFGLQQVLPSAFLSGFLKEILQRESTLERTTYTFFHLTLQEFIAACYYFLDSSVLIEELFKELDSCKDGRFEILTRFLAGLARPPVTELLKEILGDFEKKHAVKTLDWVKKRTQLALQSADKNETLRVFQWLFETQNKKLIRDCIGKESRLEFRDMTLSPLDCAALGSVISYCGELKELQLFKLDLTPECIRRLAIGLGNCKSVSLESSCVTSQCCKYLSSYVSAKHSVLTALQLRGNKLEDEGMRLLCEGLREPNCKLQILEVESCDLTARGCEFLSMALNSEYTQLQELDLESNTLKDSGAIQLCEGLRSPHCKLRRLRMAFCQLTHECCTSFSSALCVEHSLLMELELEGNELGDEGVHLLCEGLRKPNCKLEKLWLDKCGLTSGCCGDLSSALCTEHSRLTELHLGDNKLANSGVQLLCEGLKSLNCKLERLRLDSCDLTSECCKALSSVLCRERSCLSTLELGQNTLTDLGMGLLCEGLKNLNCKLQTLRLWSCGLTSKCCECLLSALCAEHSHLTVLDLAENNLKDAGAGLLCEALRNPNCKLEKVRFKSIGISKTKKNHLKSLQEELSSSGRHIKIIT
ncbi:NACHT, LRR and PYD domains-containing protein 3-like isoform X2 [Polypterus senegalus]|uniref:NACHT, LRR and PYD domains-containing protein 3-like isoform X2 n=1 Tax=Polypterus senegalus TaxID=55291 RepID=UPI0019625D9E|nr:NACHT, LRR and PYD domains-containing protein 3-like isoform X2 [Polypterus senegalus]